MLVFLISTGLIIWVFPDSHFNILENGYATLEPLFVLAPWLFLFLIPAVTMRTFAEEKKSGTIELLLTKPLTDFQLVFAKYSSAFVLVVASLAPTLVYLISIYYLSTPVGNVDLAGIAGSYIGLLLLCSGFVSIGIFCSSVSGNQIVSFIVSLIICFFFYNGFDFISTIIDMPFLSNVLAQTGISIHYVSLSRGVIDSRDVIYFFSLTLFFLFLSRFTLERRKW